MKATALLLGVAVGASTSVASADIVLTFDDLGLPDGTAVTDQYARFGVMFSAGDTWPRVQALGDGSERTASSRRFSRPICVRKRRT